MKPATPALASRSVAVAGPTLNIERVVLDGFALTPRQVRQFETALAGELSRLLGVAPAGSAAGGRVGGPPPRVVHDPVRADASRLGRQVAAAVHQELLR